MKRLANALVVCLVVVALGGTEAEGQREAGSFMGGHGSRVGVLDKTLLDDLSPQQKKAAGQMGLGPGHPALHMGKKAEACPPHCIKGLFGVRWEEVVGTHRARHKAENVKCVNIQDDIIVLKTTDGGGYVISVENMMNFRWEPIEPKKAEKPKEEVWSGFGEPMESKKPSPKGPLDALREQVEKARLELEKAQLEYQKLQLEHQLEHQKIQLKKQKAQLEKELRETQGPRRETEPKEEAARPSPKDLLHDLREQVEKAEREYKKALLKLKQRMGLPFSPPPDPQPQE